MNGKSVSLPGGDFAVAAIDTGTTLIGGPTAAVESIWGAVPGSQALDGNHAGYFAFRTFLLSFPLSAGALRVGILVYRVGLMDFLLLLLYIQRVTLSCPSRYLSEARHGPSVLLT